MKPDCTDAGTEKPAVDHQAIVRLDLCQTGLRCLQIVSVCWEPDGLGHPQTQFVVDDTHDPVANGDCIVFVPAQFRERVTAALAVMRDQLTDGESFVQDYDRGDGVFAEASI